MDTSASNNLAAGINFGASSLDSISPLPRDQEQSHRLHEPTSMISSIDPINGHDVMGVTNHPSIIDGILTIYFESEETRTEYLNTPVNRPYNKLLSEPSDEDDRGG